MSRNACDRPAPPAGLLILLLLCALALVAPAARAPGAPPAAADEAWEKVVVLYHSDVGGKIEPCG